MNELAVCPCTTASTAAAARSDAVVVDIAEADSMTLLL